MPCDVSSIHGAFKLDRSLTMDSIPQKRCTKCGVEKPLTAFSLYKGEPRRQCRACMQVYNRRYYDRNTEKAKAYAKNWNEEHADHVKARKSQEYAKNKEYYTTKARAWYAANREHSIQRSLAYFRTEKGKIRNRLNTNKHRALERQGDVTPNELTELMQRQTRCAYCKKVFSDKLPATIDHVIPLSKGGPHTISNLVLACKPCNSRKHNNPIYLL